MYKFNNNDIITGYIKQLLHSFNLPCLKVYRKNEIIYPNNYYIYKTNLVKSIYPQIYRCVSDEIDNNKFEIVNQNYQLNDFILNITKNLEIKSLIYDSYTHKYLGEYLRLIKNYFNIDLMTMYNCFSNEVGKNINIENFNSENNDYSIFVIPAKFYKQYIIGIDCDADIELISCYYSNNRLIKKIDNTYIRRKGNRFKNPFIYTKLLNPVGKEFWPKKDYINESTLTILLKIPVNCKSSISIIELDDNSKLIYKDVSNLKDVKYYLKNTSTLIKDNKIKQGFIQDTNDDNNELTLVSKLQLFNINDNISYPFSDRLVEYIFENCINPIDKIDNNIKNLQLKLGNRYNKENDKPEIIINDNGNIKYYDIGLNPSLIGDYGFWNDNITKVLKEIQNNKLINDKFDLQGHLDKDTEYYLGGDDNV